MTLPVVSLAKVSKVFASAGETSALIDIDLSINAGETVAITGPSGSGKSTLLHILCGLDVPTSGSITFEGRDLAKMSDDERTRLRRERIGLIFQTFNLMPTLSAVENVALPLRLDGMSGRESMRRAADILASVDLGDRLTNRPDEMSGGERQRVAIARALVLEPSLLLADEPTGNLDSASGENVLDLLDRIHSEGGTTIVLVTHNEEAAARCNRHVRLLDGKLVQDNARAEAA